MAENMYRNEKGIIYFDNKTMEVLVAPNNTLVSRRYYYDEVLHMSYDEIIDKTLKECID